MTDSMGAISIHLVDDADLCQTEEAAPGVQLGVAGPGLARVGLLQCRREG